MIIANFSHGTATATNGNVELKCVKGYYGFYSLYLNPSTTNGIGCEIVSNVKRLSTINKIAKTYGIEFK